MNAISRHGKFAILLLVVVAMVVLAVPSVVYAATGDADNPQVMSWPPWSQAATGTTIPYSEGGETWAEYNYLLPLAKGKTYRFTSTMPTDENGMFILSSTLHPPGVVVSDQASGGVGKLTFMAPSTRYYRLTIVSSDVETFTMSAGYAPTTYYRMSRLVVPKAKRRNQYFRTIVKVSPQYNSLGSPIKFEIQRKVGKRYRRYATVGSSIYSETAGFTKYSKRLKIKKRGIYRIRARFSDAAHKTKYTGYKRVRIK